MNIFKNSSILFILILVHTAMNLQARESEQNAGHSLRFSPKFVQIKDDFNYGLNFNGLNLEVGYLLEKKSESHLFTYSADLAFGANYNNGIGLFWQFKPVDIFYGFDILNKKDNIIFIGPYFQTFYNWQLYPELQSGQMFWFSSFELGPKIHYSFPVRNRIFKVMLSNSVMGLTSRPEPATETYFYSLTAANFVNNVHSNLKFGFNNTFNHTILKVDMKNPKKKRISLGYTFEYFGYYSEPTLSYIGHSVNLTWKLGKL